MIYVSDDSSWLGFWSAVLIDSSGDEISLLMNGLYFSSGIINS
jgi:hypothetical protein